jgi:hypothetical protein
MIEHGETPENAGKASAHAVYAAGGAYEEAVKAATDTAALDSKLAAAVAKTKQAVPICDFDYTKEYTRSIQLFCSNTKDEGTIGT